MKKTAAGLFLDLELIAAFIRNGPKLDEQRVIGPRWTGIIHRDVAINAVILAGEDKSYLLFDPRRAIVLHVDVAVEFGNVITARPCRQAENQRQEQNHNFSEFNSNIHVQDDGSA